MKIDEARLAEFDTIELQAGAHEPDHTFCVMEAVAYVAGEPWTDKPACACPVLTAFMIAWNDGSSHEQRQELKPWIPRLAGTRSTREVELARSWMACDWLVRTFTPTWLRRAGLEDDAATLGALLAASHAWDAAWDAARDALAPTLTVLRVSAFDLLDRMIAVTPESLLVSRESK